MFKMGDDPQMWHASGVSLTCGGFSEILLATHSYHTLIIKPHKSDMWVVFHSPDVIMLYDMYSICDVWVEPPPPLQQQQ